MGEKAAYSWENNDVRLHSAGGGRRGDEPLSTLHDGSSSHLRPLQGRVHHTRAAAALRCNT